MSGEPRFAVDTSFVIAILKGAIHSDHRLDQIRIPVPVVGELCFGALNSRDRQGKLEEIEELISGTTVVPNDVETGRVYAELRHRLKIAGLPIPENDVWIAAVCVQHGLTLLTLDRHFQNIEGLKLSMS